MPIELTGRDGKVVHSTESNVTVDQTRKTSVTAPAPVAPGTEPAAPSAAPAAAPAAEAAAPETVSPEQLQELRRNFAAKSFGLDGAKAPRKKKEDKPKVEEPAKEKTTEETKAEEDAKAKKAEDDAKAKAEQEKADKEKADKAAKAKAAKGEEDDELEKAVDDAEKAIKPRTPTAHPKVDMTKTEASTPGLTQAQDRKLKYLAQLAKDNPDQYKNIVADTKKFWELEKARIDKWNTENPETPYDPDDATHADFYSKYSPDVDADDFDSARETVIREQAREAARAEIRSDAERREVVEQMRSAGPKIEQVALGAVGDFVKEAAPELYTLCLVDGKPTISPAVIEKMKEADPVAFEILQEQAATVQAVVFELEYMEQFPRHYPPNPDFAVTLGNGEEIYPHAIIQRYARKLETEMAKKPESETTLPTGQKFMKMQEYVARIERINKLPDDQYERALKNLQERYYTLDTPRVRKSFLWDCVDRAAKKIEKLSQSAEKKYKTAPASSTAKVEEAKPEKVEETEVRGRKGVAPSTLSASDKVSAGNGNGSETQGITEILNRKMWPKG
jgi:hypothetical protein